MVGTVGEEAISVHHDQVQPNGLCMVVGEGVHNPPTAEVPVAPEPEDSCCFAVRCLPSQLMEGL